MGFWDRFGHGDRYKFVHPGDRIEGTIVALSATDFGGSADEPVPVLTIKTEFGDRDVCASQRVLVGKLAEEAPEVGDWISIVYDGEADKARPGRSPAKLFSVTVKRKEEPSPALPLDDEPF